MKRLIFATLVTSGIVATSACDDPLALTPPYAENIMDTVTVFALQGTPLGVPSGYDVARRSLAAVENQPFDISFDIDANGVARLFPRGALGLPMDVGVLSPEDGFAVDEAPIEGYSFDSTFVVAPDSVLVVRSRSVTDGCPFFLGALPRYGKFRILSVSAAERTIVMEGLVNINCGYRQLQVGVPTR